MPLQVAVVGAGSWGTSLALVLVRNGHTVHLYGKDTKSLAVLAETRENRRYLPDISLPPEIKIEPSLAQALNESDEVLIAVPSHAFREVLVSLLPHLQKDQGISWVTKGLDSSARFLHEVVAEITGPRPMALLSGPSFAREVAESLPTAVVVAGNDAAYAKKIQALFQNRHFRVYLSQDLLGAEIGGAVKNVLALAVGIAEGLGFHTNTKAALMTRGLAEMMRLGKVLGAKRETLTGLSGLGDLILTCSDRQSRNLRLGIMLGQGLPIDAACEKIGQAVESVTTAELVYLLAQKHVVRMPITEAIYAILYRHIPLAEIFERLLQTPAKAE